MIGVIPTLLFMLLSLDSCASILNSKIASVQNIGVGLNFSGGNEYVLNVSLAPNSSAKADTTYNVDLYEKGQFMGTTTVNWNQPQINVHDEASVSFPISNTEGSAYWGKDVSKIYSVKITTNTTAILATPSSPVVAVQSTTYTSLFSDVTTTNPIISTIIVLTTPAPETPVITNVSKISATQTQTININGHGFGNLDPYNGNSKYIEISDATQGWDAGHSASNGETDNGVLLNVAQWNDNQILISGFTGKYGNFSLHVGDNLLIKVWNSPSGLGPSSYSLVCGASTIASSATLVIANVSVSTTPTQTFTINGQGFGNLDPYNGDSPFIEITNVTSSWNAGFSGGNGQTPNGLMLNISLWTDNQIVISGFTGSFPASFQAGDNLTFKIWNVPSGLGPASLSIVYMNN